MAMQFLTVRVRRECARLLVAGLGLVATLCGFANVASAQNVEEVTKLIAGGSNNFMGGAVAMSDDTVVVGGGPSAAAEAVYVFARDANGAWGWPQQLTANDGVVGDDFGFSVAIDGDTIVVGAERADHPTGGADTGAAYVFVRDGSGAWTQQRKLLGDSIAGDYFGSAVGVSGNVVVVGARGDDDNGSAAGAAYVFRRSGTIWSSEQKLTASDGSIMDDFGASVAIDGATILVGARLDDPVGSTSGSAYVFADTGALWVQQQKLVASAAAATDKFGWSVSLSGNTALIGAPGHAGTGAALAFEKSGSTWSEQRTLIPFDGVSGDRFGEAVSVSDGLALVGAPNHQTNGYASGAAYLYVIAGSFFQKLTAQDASASDYFGGSVALEGNVAAIGARSDDHVNIGSNVGSVYVFDPDSDGDGITDPSDNCPDVSNPGQADSDGDGVGDACEADADADGVIDDDDNCPAIANPSQEDLDGDLDGDACDICPADDLNDVDADGWCGNEDNCPNEANADQANADGDAAGDVCDPCPADAANDADGDGVCGDVDICPGSDDNLDADGDGAPDGCDICPGGDDGIDTDSDGTPDYCDICPLDALNDADGDGVCGNDDICAAGNDTADADGDSVPDACDLCPFDPDNDADLDMICGDVDPCPIDPDNDADGDGVCGDVDICPGGDDNLDTDGDTAPDFCDVCPVDAANDNDGDGICEVDDNCDVHANSNQLDTDGDGVGDACEPDTDGDGVVDDTDNCLYDPNPDQLDTDGDGVGDACDSANDTDGDGVSDEVDACLGTPAGEPVLSNGCSLDQLAPCDNPWKNHGAYVKAMKAAAQQLVDEGVITDAERGAMVNERTSWSCGR